jgi:hypothetical protein
MQAKDQQITELRAAIQQRDSSLQKFIKLNGSLVQNPKEEPYSKVVLQNYERAQVLQEEKIGLSEKAAALVSFAMGFVYSTLAYSPHSWTVMSSDSTLSCATYRMMAPFHQIHRCHRCSETHLATWWLHRHLQILGQAHRCTRCQAIKAVVLPISRRLRLLHASPMQPTPGSMQG